MLDEEVKEVELDTHENVLDDDIDDGIIKNDIDDDVDMANPFNVESEPNDMNVDLYEEEDQ